MKLRASARTERAYVAASRFPPVQKDLYDVAGKARDPVTSKMTPAQIAEAERLVKEWKPR